MKSISIVTRSMYGGGAERVIAQLLKEFCNNGIRCQLIMIDNEPDFYEIPEIVEVLKIGKISKNEIMDRISRYTRMKKAIRIFNPEIVLSMPEDIGIYVLFFMLFTTIPVVVSERNNPWVMPYSKISRVLRKICYPFGKGFIFQTKEASSFFSSNIQKKGIVLPNPLDLARLCDPFEGERKKTIVSAGRLDRQKNYMLLLEAFKELHEIKSDYDLVIYGEGNERVQLEEFIKDNNLLNSIRLPGKSSSLIEQLRDACMFVLSSDYEGSPNVLIEAMAIGVPSISTDCPSGGPKELIENYKNGILIPVGDKGAMKEAMMYIIDNPKVAKNMGQQAIKIRKQLDANKVIPDWIAYLDSKGNKR